MPFETDILTGERIYIDGYTGEVLPTKTCIVPVGARTFMPEQTRDWEMRKEREAKAEYQKKIGRELGNFVFVVKTDVFSLFKPQSVARLIYLSTCLKDKTEKFIRKGKNRGQACFIRRKDLSEVLHIAKSTAFDFLHEVMGTFIEEDADGSLVAKNGFAMSGQSGKGIPYTRVYKGAVKRLYEGTPSTKHKYIGYIFKMLPYLNVKWNILCWNTTCEDLYEINPMTMREFCDEIGYDMSQAAKLRKVYSEILFAVNDHRERLCTFIPSDDGTGMRIFVNPHIVYSGNDYHAVKARGQFEV